jgi:A/G-specific adenine glycosylase
MNVHQNPLRIVEKLLDWYQKHHRDLPWRRTSDPYHIWISEVILQQTRVDQGLDYYLLFMERFPNVHSLAEAGEEEVLKLWQGLGYYSRARHLHQSARKIVEKHAGNFPATHQDLITLPGIGEYTSAAILSICFDQPYPVVDGNVIRVLSRIYCVCTPSDTSAGKNEIKGLALRLIPHSQPGTFNQALMEFGALQCRPVNPDCNHCPLQENCCAFEQQTVGELPATKRQTKIISLFIHYLFIVRDSPEGEMILIRKRTRPGIWKNLYDFPSVETGRLFTISELEKHSQWLQMLSERPVQVTEYPKVYRHRLSHRELVVQFLKVSLQKASVNLPEDNCKWVRVQDLDQYPIPRLISRFLEDNPYSGI